VFSEDEVDIPIFSSRALNGPDFHNKNLRKKQQPNKKRGRRRPSVQEDKISDFRADPEDSAPSVGKLPLKE